MPRRPQRHAQDLVLADIPERVELRDLQAELNGLRDAIGALDLEIENLREDLVDFERGYEARLAAEHFALRRIEHLVAHFERWSELLSTPPAPAETRKRADRIERRRQREIERRKVPDPEEPAPKTATVKPRARDEDLKTAYRELARRYHPDLARTEEERVHNSNMMTRINALYRAGDTDRLRALSEQAKGSEVEVPDLELDDQLTLLRERRSWFEKVLGNLHDERSALERSSTCQLMRNVAQAEAQGRDLVGELKRQLRTRVRQSYKNVRKALEHLERQVTDFNRRGGLEQAKNARDLAKIFDPFGDKRMMRLGLEQLDAPELDRSAKKWHAWLLEAAPQNPGLLRLVLLTYVSELSPFPLAGLERYDDLAQRFDALRQKGEKATLEETLVEGDDMFEYGVKRATDKVVHMGLRFRNKALSEAIPVAIRDLDVRREFKRILAVLGEAVTCSACHQDIFAVPLYRTRGIDDLHASVCPACGHRLKSYWLPKGEDVQSVLNTAFVDFEIVSEWTFGLSQSSLSMQLVPAQVDTMTVGDLKRELVETLFVRHELEIGRSHVVLLQEGKRVPEKTPIDDLDSPRFEVQFTADAALPLDDALEIVRHRIRNRFRGG